MISGLRIGFRAARRLIVADEKLALSKAKIRGWFRETFRSARFYEILKTSFAEAAVLWAVFPVVDVWESTGSSSGKNWTVVYYSPLFTVVFLLLSALAAKRFDEASKEGKGQVA